MCVIGKPVLLQVAYGAAIRVRLKSLTSEVESQSHSMVWRSLRGPLDYNHRYLSCYTFIPSYFRFVVADQSSGRSSNRS